MLSPHYNLLLLLAISSSFVLAAPKRRGCHFEDFAYSENVQTSTSTFTATNVHTETIDVPALETQPSTATKIPESKPVGQKEENGGDDDDDGTDMSIRLHPSFQPEHFTTLTTVLSYASIPPDLVLLYPNTTITEPLSLSRGSKTSLRTPTANTTSIHHPSSPSPSPSRRFSSTPKTQYTRTPPSRPSRTTPTTTTPIKSPTPFPFITPTTPNLAAMQTNYYLSVCAQPSHANDAICLGPDVMMCCRSDNVLCSGVLVDGGLYCGGVRSGDWARTWTRGTVTFDGGGTTSTTDGGDGSGSLSGVGSATAGASASGGSGSATSSTTSSVEVLTVIAVNP